MVDYISIMDAPSEMCKSKEETDERTEEQKRELLEKIKVEVLSALSDTGSFTISSCNIKLKAELCIYKVPDKLRKMKEDAYIPRVVAIGLFHRDKAALAPMAKHKLSYMASLLALAQYTEDSDLASTVDKRLKDCIDAIYGLDEAIRHCYGGNLDPKISKAELVDMMVVDGCFILELFLRNHLKSGYIKEYKSDPVLRSAWTMTAITHDLALLENQIPFFILEILYRILCPVVQERCNKDCEVPRSCEVPKSVARLALSFFKPMSRKKITEEAPDEEFEDKHFKHLLDLLHKYYFPPVLPVPPSNGNDIESNTNPKRNRNGRRPAIKIWGFGDTKRKRKKRPAKTWGFSHSASELLESGIEFQKASSSQKSLLHITFNEPVKNGVINIPQLRIHDTTSISLFRNLIAFEQCSLGSKQSVTSYAFLMKSLINSSVDSKLLERREIIEHSSNGDKEYLANKFRSILEGVDLMEDFSFRELCDSVNACRKSRSNQKRRWKVRIRNQCRLFWVYYLSVPWKVVSGLAAAAILILTYLQTYYTINPRK